MKKNIRFTQKNGAPIQDIRIGGKATQHALIAGSGEMNAYNQKDLLVQIGRLMTQASSGQVVQTTITAAERLAVQREQKEILAALQNDNVGTVWRETEATFAAEINEALPREGFLRRFVIEEPLSQGQDARIRVKQLNVVGTWADGPGEVSPQLINDKIMYPPEFTIVVNVEVDERDLARSPGDLLDEKYQEGLQSAMVQEDRMWKLGADATVGTENALTTIAGALTPTYLASIQELVSGWHLPVTQCLLANDYWKDIATNPNWLTAFDPVTAAEVLLTGKLGTIYGMTMNTDGFRPPELKVLEPGELYVLAQPDYHGAITTRGGIVPNPVNGAQQSRTTRGWFMFELISFMIANNRSVAKAVRG